MRQLANVGSGEELERIEERQETRVPPGVSNLKSFAKKVL